MDEQEGLTEDQRHQMIVTLRPEDGWPVHLNHTPELEQDYREWLLTECKHETTELRKTITKNGAPYFGIRCTVCDERIGNWLSKTQVASPETLPVADPDGPAKFERVRREAWRATQHRHLAAQQSVSDADYDQYLASPEWRRLREKVLARANGICEGCGDAAATQVHHLTYTHIYAEFLWELVAVCDECHARVHADKHLKVDEDD